MSSASYEPSRRYDTFVVRLWRDTVANRWLRVDVEHVQGRSVVVHRWSRDGPGIDDAPQWLLQCLQDTAHPANPTDSTDRIDSIGQENDS